jgi:hypothetical protein
MGLGMTISVAPLTTTVMNAVPEYESGIASGINNAVSRLAALLAVAVFGAVLVIVFNHSLNLSLDQLALTPDVRARVDAARPLLAATHNPNPMVQRAITESFVNGYRSVIWVATGVAALSAITALLLIGSGASTLAKSPMHSRKSERVRWPEVTNRDWLERILLGLRLVGTDSGHYEVLDCTELEDLREA